MRYDDRESVSTVRMVRSTTNMHDRVGRSAVPVRESRDREATTGRGVENQTQSSATLLHFLCIPVTTKRHVFLLNFPGGVLAAGSVASHLLLDY